MTEPKAITAKPRYQDEMTEHADVVERIQRVCRTLMRKEGITYTDALLKFYEASVVKGEDVLMPHIRTAVNDNANMKTLDRGIGLI